MTARDKVRLDPRAWLLWVIAASAVPMLGRNPWPLTVVFLAAVGVRTAWSDQLRGGHSWTVFFRIAVFFATISTLFNVLTVRAGDRVIATLPDAIPLIGGEITLNAAAFGVLSGFALVLLVLIGSTVAALLDWPAIVRLLPDGFTSIAVAGSIAFAFVPQTAIAYREIKEAQSARGHRIRGGRDLLPVIVPLLTLGLERAITLAEALESRAFGAPVSRSARSPVWIRYATALGLAAASMVVYLAVSGRTPAALVCAGFAIVAFIAVARFTRPVVIHRTRYRTLVWTRRDTLVSACSVLALLITIVTLERSPTALQYEPYPHLSVPVIDLPLLAAQLALLAPVFVSPSEVDE